MSKYVYIVVTEHFCEFDDEWQVVNEEEFDYPEQAENHLDELESNLKGSDHGLIYFSLRFENKEKREQVTNPDGWIKDFIAGCAE